MESPVRICLGAALVVNLLLVCGTAVDGGTIPQETTTNAPKDERAPGLRLNSTWPAKGKPRVPDVSLNELSHKDSTSEEHTEKQNAKYKDRGKIRYNSQTLASTFNPSRRARSSSTTSTTSTEPSTLIIVTPTAEAKTPSQIIERMRNFKKTKLPPSTSSTTPMSVKHESETVEEFENKEETEDGDSFEKFISTRFHDSNFFTIPSFDDDFKHDSDNESSNNKVKQDFSSSPYSFSSFFPKKDTYSYEEDSDPFKSSFFDFDTELTTPRNDFFDKKFEQISASIIKNLDSIKAKSPPPNITNVHKISKENIGFERLSNNTPSNKSSVFLKNTKEIRLMDNQDAGTAKKELSDMQGTSIYYEMSVLSTETYAINHSNDDDCDNDTTTLEATASTSPQEELAAIKATQPTVEIETTKQIVPQTTPEVQSTVSSNLIPISSPQLVYNTLNVVPISTQNFVSTTERATRIFSSSITRNRNYSKRLNLTGSKDSPNSVTVKIDLSANTIRPTPMRKFYTTTKTTKPIWISPRRNVTRIYMRPTKPTTIYSEHFNIKDKFTTPNTRQPNRSVLTTVPSAEIDPVLQSDISGIKKIVYSQSISDNTIPSLRKRGSTRFTTSATSSKETDLSELEIPSTAWALASLISPPSLPNHVVNITENELQKVGEIIDKKETTIGLITTTTTASPISNDIITKKVTEVDQNKLPWQPTNSPTPSFNRDTINETKHEKLPADSIISESNAELVTTETVKDNSIESKAIVKDNLIETKSKPKEVKPIWISAMDIETSTATSNKENETIRPVDGTKSTSFESITKLPADVTTPQDETVAGSEVNQTISDEKPKTTTDMYEITTIRFSYVPTEAIELTTDYETPDSETSTTTWHSVLPTRTKLTTIQDGPITTYRPKYLSTTEMEEITTIIPDTTPVLEVSSQIIANATEKIPETTTILQTTTEELTTEPSTTSEATTDAPILTTTPVATTTSMTTTITTTTTEQPTVTPTTETHEDTTTIVVEVKTEINTEKVTIIIPGVTTETPTETTELDFTSEENSDSNEIIHDTKTTESEETYDTETTTDNTRANIMESTSEAPINTTQASTRFTTTAPLVRVVTTEPASITESTTNEATTEAESETTANVNELEDLTSYVGMTTEASSQVTQPLPDVAGSGAAVAIAVSTIGVIALILLVGLLLVVRRRGRRGVYAQRCTPVSLDAYSLDSVSVGHRKGNQRLRASKRSYGNPAYDDEVTSHPMQYPALANFALDVDSMTAEFGEIPAFSVRPEEVPPGCEDKNRYSNVLPLPETRVPLRRIGNDPASEYINANYVTGPGNIRNYYILAQAPLSNTVIDFWRMVWEQNSRLLVMLTEYMENGVEKCYEYLPPSEISDNKRTFGEFQIILKKREQRDKYAISSVQVINLTTRSWREVTHLWYFWPAKGVPEDYDSVIDFLFEMRNYMKVAQTAKEYDEEGVEVIYGDQNRSSFNNLAKFRDDNSSGNGVNVYSPAKAEEQNRRGYANNGTLSRMKAASEVEGIRPCIVTCASGAGRSAAVCALDICARALHAGACDLPRVVRHLRTQRPHSLSNRHHYMFVYKVLSEYGNKMMGVGDTI